MIRLSRQMAQTVPAPAPVAPPAPAPAAPAPPPPPPPPQKVTIPSGTTLAVRLVDAIDSETATQGQTFHATLNSPLAVDGATVIPTGYSVEGHVVTVQSAGKFAGQSLLVLQLDRISAAGNTYNIQTDQYNKQGSSRGQEYRRESRRRRWNRSHYRRPRWWRQGSRHWSRSRRWLRRGGAGSYP